jgi:hypothetical protein
MALLPRDFLGGFANGEEGLRNDAVENRSASKRKVSFREDTAPTSQAPQLKRSTNSSLTELERMNRFAVPCH